MSLSPEKTEHYTLIRIQKEDQVNSFLNKVQEFLQENDCQYLLLDLSPMEELLPTDLVSLTELSEILGARNGLLATIYRDEELMRELENSGVLLLPSEHEAIEYVMMDHMEKQFLDGEESDGV